ncbi:MAG: hypothetical protein ACE5KV_09055, partial [Thermoplasmata archaeon]
DYSHLEEIFAMAKEYGAHYILSGSLTMEGQQRDWLMRIVREHYPELVPKYEELYPNNAYSPAPKYCKELSARTMDLCRKYELLPRIPKPIFGIERGKQRKIDSW